MYIETISDKLFGAHRLSFDLGGVFYGGYLGATTKILKVVVYRFRNNVNKMAFALNCEKLGFKKVVMRKTRVKLFFN